MKFLWILFFVISVQSSRVKRQFPFGFPQNQDFGQQGFPPPAFGMGGFGFPGPFNGPLNGGAQQGPFGGGPPQFGGNQGQPPQFGGNQGQPGQFGGNQQPGQFGGNQQPGQFGGNQQPGQFGGNQQPQGGGNQGQQGQFGGNQQPQGGGNQQQGQFGGNQAQPQGGGNQRTTTAAPVSPQVQACSENCIMSTASPYNPVCASDGVTYHNRERFDCNVECGRRITLTQVGACPSRLATTSRPN